MNEKFKVLGLALLIIIVGVLVYFYYPANRGRQTFSSENVSMGKLDVSQPPADFPSDIPLEKANIVQQSQSNYPDRGVVFYAVSYRSTLQLEELYANYQKYFTTHGYTIVSSSKSPKIFTLDANKANDSISVVLTPDNGFNLVKISVLNRK